MSNLGWSRYFAVGVVVALSSGAYAEDARKGAWRIAIEGLKRNIASVVLPHPNGDSRRSLAAILMGGTPPLNADPKRYLLAGSNQFRTLWVRDFAMSVPGALAIGEDATVRDSLEIIFSGQRSDGLLPRLVDNKDIGSRFVLGLAGFDLGFDGDLQPWFETENGVISLDSNAAIPWVASLYIAKSKDRRFAERWLPAAEAAVVYLEKTHGMKGLVGSQPPYSDWADSVRRTGRVAFTNELYYLALRGMQQWTETLGFKEKSSEYRAKSERFLKAFRSFFWMPERRMVRNFEGDDRMALDANLFAVVYGIIGDQDREDAMKTLRASPLWQPIPGRVAYPDYPDQLKSSNVKLVGLQGYHDRMYWYWLTALAAQAERAVGNCVAYNSIIDQVSSRIVKDGAVHEVYDLENDGQTLKPVSRVLYKAEKPFTWSSAMYLYAAQLGCNEHSK